MGFNLTLQKKDFSLNQITRVINGRHRVPGVYIYIHLYTYLDPKWQELFLEVSFSHIVKTSSSLSNIPLWYLAQAALQQTTTIRLAKIGFQVSWMVGWQTVGPWIPCWTLDPLGSPWINGVNYGKLGIPKKHAYSPPFCHPDCIQLWFCFFFFQPSGELTRDVVVVTVSHERNHVILSDYTGNLKGIPP